MGQKNTKKNLQKIEKLNINNQQNTNNKSMTNQQNINNKSMTNQQNINNKSMTNQQNVNKSKENDLNINQIQINNPYLKYFNSIKEHNDWIESVKIFPSGNIISVSDDCSIKIFDGLNYKIIQNIKYSHKLPIMNIYIKDEYNFATCSEDKNINIWTKIENKFILNISITNAHNNSITNLIYLSNNNIISCSNDTTIKIWELHNNKYQLLTFIKITSNQFNYYININSLLL
jgi:WD40 repeat protein